MSTIVQVSVVDKQSVGGENGRVGNLPERWDLNSDNALLSVYCFIKNFIGVSTGTNTVAIDNKIEQAMDLVKSHLMFAVREEVDVLKEKITELMDKISLLEQENGILKANATPEMLSQLNSENSGAVTQPSNPQQQTPAMHEHP